MVFSTQSWFCKGTGREIDKRVSYHLVKSIGLVRDRLTDSGEARISDTTINAVVMLAGQALLMGEASTAREHVLGLRRLVEMRGGFGGLEGNVKLVTEVVRMDISLALYTDSDPIFHETCEKKRWYRLPRTVSTSWAGENLIDNNDLRQLWLTTLNFSTLINNATSACHKLPEELMLETMASVMYRLLAKNFELSSLDEAIRLGLLAFCSQAFLPWTSVKLPFDSFPNTYLSCVEHLTKAQSTTPGSMIWILTIGIIALYPPGCGSERMLSLLRNRVVESGITSWEEVRKTLKEHFWLDLIFDDAAEALWKRIMEAQD